MPSWRRGRTASMESSPAAPVAPVTRRPPLTTAPPTPVPMTTMTPSVQPSSAPSATSASAAQRASFWTDDGRSRRSRRASTRLRSFAYCRAPPCTISPVTASTVPGRLTAIPSTRSGRASAICEIASTSESNESCGVGTLPRTSVRELSLDTAHLMKVPPISIARSMRHSSTTLRNELT